MPDIIEVDPKKLGGKPVIKGTRVPVQIILEYVEDGATIDEILDDYPHLTRDAVREVIRLAKIAHESVSKRKLANLLKA